MISTGISGIDDMLGGGIPRGSNVLYSMEPGVDGQLFMISTLIAALSKKHSCLVVLPHTTVEAFRYDAAGKRGCPIAIFNENVAFIDSIDRERIEKTSKDRRAARNAWETRIRKLCAEREVDCVFLYLDLLYEDFGLDRALAIAQAARSGKDTTLFLEHLNLEGYDLSKSLETHSLFDLVITIRSSFQYHPHFNYFTLLHASWTTSLPRSVPFTTTSGRIVPYIPKIVVTGPAQGGKSTFVTNASDLGFSVDRVGLDGESTTVAMDFGWMKWKDFEITLFGTPGKPRFDPVIPTMLRGAMGAVLVIDATKPETFQRAKHHLMLIRERRLPFVIAANKYDLPGTSGEAEIRRSLVLKDDVPVYCISANRRADIRRVIESLVDSITRFQS